MEWTDVLESPIVWFLVMIAAGWILYLVGARLAPPFRPVGMKAKAYTGGEDMPGQDYHPGYQFFHVALFFTLMHIAAIMVATAPPKVAPWAAIAYLGVVSVSIAVLRWK